MSKAAIKLINANVTDTALRAVLMEHLNDAALRKSWRNAEILVLAMLDSMANAYQCENSGTFAAHGFTDINHAIECYICANLCEWTQATYPRAALDQALGRLIAYRTVNAEFESAAQGTATFAPDDMEFLAVFETLNAEQAIIYTEQCSFFGALDHAGRQRAIEEAHEQALNIAQAELMATHDINASDDYTIGARSAMLETIERCITRQHGETIAKDIMRRVCAQHAARVHGLAIAHNAVINDMALGEFNEAMGKRAGLDYAYCSQVAERVIGFVVLEFGPDADHYPVRSFMIVDHGHNTAIFKAAAHASNRNATQAYLGYHYTVSPLFGYDMARRC